VADIASLAVSPCCIRCTKLPAASSNSEAAAYLHDSDFRQQRRHHKHACYLVANSDMPVSRNASGLLIAAICRYLSIAASPVAYHVPVATAEEAAASSLLANPHPPPRRQSRPQPLSSHPGSRVPISDGEVRLLSTPREISTWHSGAPNEPAKHSARFTPRHRDYQSSRVTRLLAFVPISSHATVQTYCNALGRAYERHALPVCS